MSKVSETPTLFHMARATHHGFRSLTLLHRDAHYVRVVVNETQEKAIVGMVTHAHLARVSAYKAGRRTDVWFISTEWCEEMRYREHLRALIMKNAGSHEVPHTFTFNANDVLMRGR